MRVEARRERARAAAPRGGSAARRRAPRASRAPSSPDPPGTGRLTVKPSPSPDPASSAAPVPGYSGHSWIEQNSTASSAWKMSFVPLPWCTSQSRISTRSSAVRRARVRRGDRDVVEEAEAHRARRRGVMARRAQRRHAARRAAGEQGVGQGDRPAGGPQRRLVGPGDRGGVHVDRGRRRAPTAPRSASTCAAGCTRSSCSRVARGASSALPAEPVVARHLGLERDDPLRPLGVAGDVVGEARVVAEPGRRRHDGYRTGRAARRRAISSWSAPAPPGCSPR